MRTALWILGAVSLLAFGLVFFALPSWSQDEIWFCPMDHDIRSLIPGECPRCKMKLVSGLPDFLEYHMDLTASPAPLKVGQPSTLTFGIHDPKNGRPVTQFEVVHEKFFHMFVISEDMEFFLHDHPVFTADGTFRYDNLKLPKSGIYRVLGDFYPTAATPQLIPLTILVPGPMSKPAALKRDYSTKTDKNMDVEFWTEPSQPVAQMKTQLHFRIKPSDGFEQYLGAWGHMLAASQDLIDLVHTHPFIADGGPELQFNLTFPRPTNYRVWVQFQRKGVVNTAHFDVPVEELR